MAELTRVRSMLFMPASRADMIAKIPRIARVRHAEPAIHLRSRAGNPGQIDDQPLTGAQAQGHVVIYNPYGPPGGVSAVTYHSCQPRTRHVTISLFAGSCAP